MKPPSIFITKDDAEKLNALFQEVDYAEYRGSSYLKMLAGELRRAKIVESNELPPDVITLNSTAVLKDMKTGEVVTYTLVFPELSDVSQGKISILAPIGTAMLGYRVGDVFEWDTPGGKRSIQVMRIIFQPEATGDDQ
jgi:regulator of nucleoside diphosphate kinase